MGWWGEDELDDGRLVTDAENAIVQARFLVDFTDSIDGRGCPLPALLLELHRTACAGDRYAGRYRPGSVAIFGSNHRPPHHADVPVLVTRMFASLAQLVEADPVEASAYALWRTCWIHPFTDGNGRTARAFAYAVLCLAQGAPLGGTKMMPQRLLPNKLAYNRALEAADQSGAEHTGTLQALLRQCIADQVADVPFRIFPAADASDDDFLE